jgi:Ca2+/Na+ antiporter
MTEAKKLAITFIATLVLIIFHAGLKKFLGDDIALMSVLLTVFVFIMYREKQEVDDDTPSEL